MIHVVDTHPIVWYLEDSRRLGDARIESAIIEALGSGNIKSLSAGKMGMGTAEMGDLVAGLV